METKYVYVIDGSKLLRNHSKAIKRLTASTILGAIGMYMLTGLVKELNERVAKLEDKEER